MVLAFMRLSGSKNWQCLILLGFSGLIILSFIQDRFLVFPILMSLVWLLLFFVAGFTRIIKPARTTSGMIVAWLFIYAMSISLLLGMLGDTRLRNRIENLSKSLILKKDETSESVVKVAV